MVKQGRKAIVAQEPAGVAPDSREEGSGEGLLPSERRARLRVLFLRAWLPVLAALLLAAGLFATGLGWPSRGDLVPYALGLGFALFAFHAQAPLFFGLVLPAAAAAAFLLARGGLALPLALGEPLLLALAAVLAWARLRRERSRNLRSVQDLELAIDELRRISVRDPLTGLYNRRFAFETGKSLSSQVRRYGGDLHLLMLDLDHFKKINDKFGHPAGDEVLKGLAEILLHVVRQSDIPARIGGEEFLVILPRTGAEAAYNIANRIRDGLRERSFPGVAVRVTASLGVTGLREAEDFETAFARADACLYQSKHSGRNRVTVG